MGTLRVSLASNLGEIRRVNAALTDFLGEEGAPARVISRVRLVIEELVVNVMRYAFDEPASHRIDVDVRTEPRRVVVTVEDDGKPFDPNDAPPPPLHEPWQTRPTGGLGIFLVKSMSSELVYARQGGRNRVRVIVDYDPAKETQ